MQAFKGPYEPIETRFPWQQGKILNEQQMDRGCGHKDGSIFYSSQVLARLHFYRKVCQGFRTYLFRP